MPLTRDAHLVPARACVNSVFVRVEKGTTEAQIREAFAAFGDIANLQLKDLNRGFFMLDFATAAQAQACIKASADGGVTINDRQLQVAPRRTDNRRIGGGRGRGRGRRGDGGRGRGDGRDSGRGRGERGPRGRRGSPSRGDRRPRGRAPAAAQQ